MTESLVNRPFTNATGAPVVDNLNIETAGSRGPALLQDIWLIEKLAQFDREVIPEWRMHAKGWGTHGTFTVTKDITRYTRAKIFNKVGKQTPLFLRFSTVAGERGAADAERDIRGFAVKFYTEEGNWDIVGNADRKAVVRAYPRTQHFKEDIIQAFYDGIKDKPLTTFGNVKADVLADKDPTFKRGNFCSVIRRSAWLGVNLRRWDCAVT
jgi:hypothetical protein